MEKNAKLWCLLLILLLEWLELPIHTNGQELNVPKQFQVFLRCEEEQTNYKPFAREKFTTVSPCIAKTATESKYCFYQCSMTRLGYIDGSSGEFNNELMEKEFYRYEMFKKERTEKFIQAIKQCNKDKLFTTRNNCKTTRELYYCAHNKFIEMCKTDGKQLNVNQYSSEDVSQKLQVVTDFVL